MSDISYWENAAAGMRWDIRPFVDGRYVCSRATDTYVKVNPANETPLYEVFVGDPLDVDLAVGAAKQRFLEGVWRNFPPVKRVEILLKLANLILEHSEQLALLDSLEMGKPIQAALLDARTYAPRLVRSWAGFADKLFGVSAPIGQSTISFNTFEPRGVVGAITPWNFPTPNAVFKIAPALLAGNSIVLKPSELAPSSALRLAELAVEAGVPEGVFNVVPGLGSTVGRELASHHDVDLISFTGSTATGRQIMELSGKSNGKPLLLECGGKSPNLVFDDIDNIEAAASAIVGSLIRNQGQVCSAHTRLIVHMSVKDKLVDRVVEAAATYLPANPLDPSTQFGPLASPAQRDRVKGFVESGLSEGARAILKGDIQESHGCFVAPTIFDGVRPDMAIVREEVFGPILSIQTFEDESEALFLANETCYGLAATVWTRDLGRAKRLAHSIRAGFVTIRTSGREDPDSGCVLSMEPQKASGFGAEIGLRGLESYSTLKGILLQGA